MAAVCTYSAGFPGSQVANEKEMPIQMQAEAMETLEACSEHSDVDLRPRHSAPSPDLSSSSTPLDNPTFPFLALPLELRRMIYLHLLPPRKHKIATQIPSSGLYYNTLTLPPNPVSSFYPFGTKAPKNLTTYTVLSRNSHKDYPQQTLCIEILRTCKQVCHEAEEVLYAGGEGREVGWDFGVYTEAIQLFWNDRSPRARALIRNLRIGKYIPEFGESNVVDQRWVTLCGYLGAEIKGLRTLDLTLWSSSGSTNEFPPALLGLGAVSHPLMAEGEEERLEVQRMWRQWEWTRDLLAMESLRTARVTWWGFQTTETKEGMFDSWVAKRMVGDRVVRERMLREGAAVESVFLLPGVSA